MKLFSSNIQVASVDTDDCPCECSLAALCRRSKEQEKKIVGLGQLEAKVTELTNLVNDLKNNCITNIRLTDPEWLTVWRGFGYKDLDGWVITGITNHNNDDVVDDISRRRLEKQVNGSWATVTN